MPKTSKEYKNFGLSTKQVSTQRAKFGYNEFKTAKEFRILKILFSQFTSFLVIVLIVAGSISLLLGEITDGLAIFVIILINAAIGFSQEYKAENAVKALKKMIVPKTVVIRNGEKKELPVRELVPDDIVLINEGDKIPADLEILEAFSLKVEEAVLTGESVPVDKKAGAKDKSGQLFKGTIVSTGRAKCKVQSIGMETEFGKIVNLVSKQTETASPLTRQMNQLGKKIALIVLGLVLIIFILGLLRGVPIFNMFITAVALGVSAIPEGMPIIVTLTLAMGVQIIARKKAIVRKMNAIETLGATTVICSDKTGTLTLNEMTVTKINTGFTEQTISGEGYRIRKKIKPKKGIEDKLFEICENCNNSFVEKNIIGDPTEIALKILNRKVSKSKKYKELDEKVFTSERKMMSVLVDTGKKKEIYTKGAYEEVLKKCTHILKAGKVKKLTAKDKKEIERIAISYSKEALRVLAFAYKEHKGKFEEKALTFVGLVGMQDPPRRTVKSSIKAAYDAGIKVKIITGDNPVTALAIGKKIGVAEDKVVTGQEIDKMDDKKLKEVLNETAIFARTSPQHKYRIVDLLQSTGEVTAVTGDGVNDAPALKHAEVGIAMGIKGTEATKEVADIILKDDNFTTIVNTIKEGRRVYKNILSFTKYMLSANYDTIMSVGILTILGFPLPILPLQILWINIATDSLPALALGKSKADKGIMKESPHPKNEKIFKKFFLFISIAVFFQIIANIAVYFYGLNLDLSLGTNVRNMDLASHARTLVFTEIVVFELLFAFVCKEEKSVTIKSLFSNKFLIGAVFISFILQLFMIYSPFMQSVFKTVPLSFTEWVLLFVLASPALLVPKATTFFKKLLQKF
ncbi:HAD-IC family P-type ATPase [Candidatus Peregrinibacteria bacterium]|nr:HAD-IC family P-type ATPase [Candidatus Peregrinibacteria bacterium]